MRINLSIFKKIFSVELSLTHFLFQIRKMVMPENSQKELASKDTPFMQRLLDNPFLLLFIGITVPTLFYIVWGVMELISIPIAS